jgi:hypothetical protein
MLLLLSEVLLNVIQKIKLIFQNNIDMQLNSPVKEINLDSNEIQTISIYRNHINNILMIDLLDEICKKFPFILYYLSSNHINNSNAFSLYSTMCSDWINFLNVQCRCGKNEDEHDL